MLTFSFHETFKGLIPSGNFRNVRYIIEIMIQRHTDIFGIAHGINVARLGSFIMALGNHVIREVSLEYTWGRKAGKHLLYGLHVVYGVRIRFERHNHSFYKRHSYI